MKKKIGNEGKVFYGITRFIEPDTKPRRRYIVVKDNGSSIKVVKTNSMKLDKLGNCINDKHKVELLGIYPKLKERTLADKKVFSKNRITKEKLNLQKDNGVFSSKEDFILDDNDFERVLNNAVFRSGKKHNKHKKKDKT